VRDVRRPGWRSRYISRALSTTDFRLVGSTPSSQRGRHRAAQTTDFDHERESQDHRHSRPPMRGGCGDRGGCADRAGGRLRRGARGCTREWETAHTRRHSRRALPRRLLLPRSRNRSSGPVRNRSVRPLRTGPGDAWKSGVLTGICRTRMRRIRDLGHSAAGIGAP